MNAGRYDDLKDAIATTVFKKASDGIDIIGSDERARMDWLFDFRSLLLQPHWLNRYAEIFWERFASAYPFQVCGMETAAIPMVAAIVMKGVERGTPVNGLYIRKSRKRQGLLKQIEGSPNGEKIVLVDDLINSASTFTKQIKILRDSDAHVSDIFALLSFRSMATYEGLGVPVTTLFGLPEFGLPYQVAPEKTSADAFDIVWHFKAKRPLRNYVHEKSNPVSDGKLVYFGTDAEGFLALDSATGVIKWQSNLGTETEPSPIFSTPALCENDLYIGSRNGNLTKIDKTNGSVVWTYSLADQISASPQLAKERSLVFIGIEYGLLNKRGAVACLDMNTGTKKWIADLPGNVRATPLFISQENMVFAADDVGNVCGYDADNGLLKFHVSIKGGAFGGAVYDEKRRVAYIGSTGGVLYGIFVPTGEVVFAKQTISIFSTPLIADDALYFSSLDKCVYKIDLQTGSEQWKFKTQGRIFATPTLLDGSLWCGSNDGKLYELDPESGSLQSSFQFSERIVNRVAFDPQTKHFFVSTQANELYCLKRK